MKREASGEKRGVSESTLGLCSLLTSFHSFLPFPKSITHSHSSLKTGHVAPILD